MLNKKGFTLIELVMIIVILGILSAVALPNFYSLKTEAQIAAEQGVVGGIKSGIATYYANQCISGTCNWPDVLGDGAGEGSGPSGEACTSSNICFENVLSQGITADWTKLSATSWRGPSGTDYSYDATAGTIMALP